MSERYDEELFLGYVEGELTPEQAAQFEQRMVEDPRLRNLVAQLVLDRHRLRSLPREEAPPVVLEAVQQRLERQMLFDAPPPTPAPARQVRLARWAVYSGLAALVLITVGVIWQTLSEPTLHQRVKDGPANGGPLLAQAEPTPQDGDAADAGEALGDFKSGRNAFARREGPGADDRPSGAVALRSAPADHLDASRTRSQVEGRTQPAAASAGPGEAPPALAERLAPTRTDLADRQAAPDAGVPGAESAREAPARAGAAPPAPGTPVERRADDSAEIALDDARLADPTGSTVAGDEAEADRQTLAMNDRPLRDLMAAPTREIAPALDLLREQQLIIDSSAPEASEREVLEWARSNRVRVLRPSPEALAPTVASPQEGPSEPAERRDAEQAAGKLAVREMTLVLAPEQALALVEHLNAPPARPDASEDAESAGAAHRQRARLATPERLRQLYDRGETRTAQGDHDGRADDDALLRAPAASAAPAESPAPSSPARSEAAAEQRVAAEVEGRASVLGQSAVPDDAQEPPLDGDTTARVALPVFIVLDTAPAPADAPADPAAH